MQQQQQQRPWMQQQQLQGQRAFAAAARPPPLRAPGPLRQHHQRRRLVAARSSKAAELLQQAGGRYGSKDLTGALKLYEDALAVEGATARQRQQALYGATAVHATFGDVELAQITLREGIRQGLDFEQALADPELPPLVSSPQVLIQLRRFNQTAQNALANRARKVGSGLPGGARTRPGASSGGGRGSGGMMDADLASILGAPGQDTPAIDASVGAIVRRVLLVLLAAVGLGTALFYLGLETLFPKY